MKCERMRVLVTTNIPAPYMIDYLTELGDKTDLTVLFELKRAKDRDSSWYGDRGAGYQAFFLNGIPCGNESGFSLKIIKYLSSKKFDRIIIANPTTPTGIVALLYCRWFRVPFVIQSEGGFQGSGEGLKEKFKKYLMEKAEFYLTGMGGSNDYFLAYGATPDRLKPYPFSSLSQKDIENAQNLLQKDKVELRKQLEMKERHIVVSVGRFSYLEGYGKGYDILMRMAERVRRDVGIYIIGDEPTQEFLEWKKEKCLDHVHFISFKTKKELSRYYAAADVFAILSRGDTWGLVVNEAMSYGLPVVSSDKCVAGTELVEDGVNGFVVSLEDENKIFEVISKLACDIDRCKRYGEASMKKIEAYTIENMAEVIYQYLTNS